MKTYFFTVPNPAAPVPVVYQPAYTGMYTEPPYDDHDGIASVLFIYETLYSSGSTLVLLCPGRKV